MSLLREKLEKIQKDEYVFPVELPSGRKVSIRKIKVKDLKEMLSLQDKMRPYNLAIQLLEKTVDKPDIVSRLPKIDILKLLTELKKISYGENIELMYQCPKCRYQGEITVNLSEDVKYKPFDTRPIVINPHIEIECYPLPFEVEIQLEEQYGDNLVDFNFNYLVKSIVKIKIDGEEIEDFTEEDVKEFLENLDTKDFEKLIEEFTERLGYFTIEKEVVCEHCSNKFVAEIARFEDFLPI